MKNLRTLISDAEEHAVLPKGSDERFSGYALMGLPFESGHVLGLRRFPVTSVGPGYTSVWLRRPTGSWTIYTNVDPTLSCPRYFGSALESTSVHDIAIEWHDDRNFSVGIDDDVSLRWDVRLAATPVTRTMSAMTNAMPDSFWRSNPFLRAMGAVAGPSLRAGKVALAGSVPNRQRFAATPKRIWTVASSRVMLDGQDLGAVKPLPTQSRLGDFWMPQRGIFMIGSATFEPFDASRHSSATTG